MPIKGNPCYGCTERWVDVERRTTCHSTCERHKEAKAGYEERKQMNAEKSADDKIYERYRRLQMARYRHAKGKK